MRTLQRLVRKFVPREPDPVVAMLIRELTEAARALDLASESMKHNRVTPVVITQTRAAYRRAASIAEQTSALRDVHVPDREQVVA